jgi:hypothetical protein
MTEVETAQFWTKVEGEKERVRTFARIPQGWEGELENHPLDPDVFYWFRRSRVDRARCWRDLRRRGSVRLRLR